MEAGIVRAIGMVMVCEKLPVNALAITETSATATVATAFTTLTAAVFTLAGIIAAIGAMTLATVAATAFAAGATTALATLLTIDKKERVARLEVATPGANSAITVYPQS
jgi:hypothetical protein